MPKKSLGFAALMTSLGIMGGAGAASASASTLPQAAPIPATTTALNMELTAYSVPATYTIQPGDTLSALAARFGTDVAGLAAANHIADINLIYAGQQLTIPAGNSGSYPSSPAELTADPQPGAQAVSYSPPSQAGSSSMPSVWSCIARFESNSNPGENTGNGYYGMFQFSMSSWQAAGGQGNPADATPGEQLAVAQRLQSMSGWGNWPVTSRECGA